MGLFSREPIWTKRFIGTDKKTLREREKAVRYVREKVRDNAAVFRILSEADDISVKQAAMDKLNDDAALIKVLLEVPCDYSKSVAVKKLSNTDLLDASVYFKLRGSIRGTMLERITDRETLYQIALRDKSPGTTDDEYAQKRRAKALVKIDDPETAKLFLNDESYTVRAEAFRQIEDPQTIIDYLSTGKGCDPSLMRSKLDGFSAEDLEALDRITTLNQQTKAYICQKAGHKRGDKCRCSRCGKALTHVFDSNGVCEACGAMSRISRENVGDSDGKDWHVFGYRDVVTLRYPDGTEEVLPGATVITDRGTYNWLYQD